MSQEQIDGLKRIYATVDREAVKVADELASRGREIIRLVERRDQIVKESERLLTELVTAQEEVKRLRSFEARCLEIVEHFGSGPARDKLRDVLDFLDEDRNEPRCLHRLLKVVKGGNFTETPCTLGLFHEGDCE